MKRRQNWHKSVWNKEVTFIIQSTSPIGSLGRYHTNHDGRCHLTKDHYYGKQVVSILNKNLGTITSLVSMQAAKGALSLIRHLVLLPDVELSNRKLGRNFCEKKCK